MDYKISNNINDNNLNNLNNLNNISKIDNYDILTLLGSGSFSKVYKCKNINDNKDYVIKISNQTYNSINEIDIYKILNDNDIYDNDNNNNNILTMVDSFVLNNTNVYIVFKYIEQTKDLFDYINTNYNRIDYTHNTSNSSNSSNTFDDIKDYIYNLFKIFRDIANAIKYIHSKNILHLDIKIENILIDSKYNGYLFDFGFSCILDHIHQKNSLISEKSSVYYSNRINKKCGTPFYISPELYYCNLKPYDLGTWSDLYSFGKTIYMTFFTKICIQIKPNQYFYHRSFNLNYPNLLEPITDTYPCRNYKINKKLILLISNLIYKEKDRRYNIDDTLCTLENILNIFPPLNILNIFPH